MYISQYVSYRKKMNILYYISYHMKMYISDMCPRIPPESKYLKWLEYRYRFHLYSSFYILYTCILLLYRVFHKSFSYYLYCNRTCASVQLNLGKALLLKQMVLMISFFVFFCVFFVFVVLSVLLRGVVMVNPPLSNCHYVTFSALAK